MARALALLALWFAGCYEPPAGDNCGITCSAECPGDLVCVGGICVPEGQTTCTPEVPELVSITLGSRHACGLDRKGTAYCWGDNSRGQLGFDLDVPRLDRPRRVDDHVWSQLAANGEHTCGLTDGVAWCWGQNSDGQANGGAGGLIRTPTRVTFTPSAPAALDTIVVGGFHSCALAGSDLWCWGATDAIGLDGENPGAASQLPGAWRAISLGKEHACGIHATMGVMCWGSNRTGAVGQPSLNTIYATPTAVSGLPTDREVRRVIATDEVSCAIMASSGREEGQLWCWGENASDRFGWGASFQTAPRRVGALESWSAFAAPGSYACGIRGGNAVCFGTAYSGELGSGRWYDDEDADTAPSLGPATAIDTFEGGPPGSRSHPFNCMISSDVVRCWGDNSNGQLGIGGFSRHYRATPIATSPDATFTSVHGGDTHVCAISPDRSAWCWGSDAYGEVSAKIPRGVTQPCVASEPCNYPRPVPAPAEVTAIDTLVAAYNYTCARSGTTIRCWGRGEAGELGVTNASNGSLTAPIAPTGTWTWMSGGTRATCGISSGSSNLACWGTVAGTPRTTPIPVMMTELVNVEAISFGENFACATRSDRTRACWGSNGNGQVGDGSNTNRADAVARDAGQIASVSASGEHACALLVDGGISCWGSNNWGQSGHPTDNVVLMPNRVATANGPLTGCTKVAAGYDHACALCGGTPYCWGRNEFAALGRGDPLDYNFSGTATRVVDAPMGCTDLTTTNSGGCVIAAGKIYCWGDSFYGESGTGGQSKNLPTPLGGT